MTGRSCPHAVDGPGCPDPVACLLAAVHVGSTRDAVRDAQRALIGRGAVPADAARSGWMDPDTAAALDRWRAETVDRIAAAGRDAQPVHAATELDDVDQAPADAHPVDAEHRGTRTGAPTVYRLSARAARVLASVLAAGPRYGDPGPAPGAPRAGWWAPAGDQAPPAPHYEPGATTGPWRPLDRTAHPILADYARELAAVDVVLDTDRPEELAGARIAGEELAPRPETRAERAAREAELARLVALLPEWDRPAGPTRDAHPVHVDQDDAQPFTLDPTPCAACTLAAGCPAGRCNLPRRGRFAAGMDPAVIGRSWFEPFAARIRREERVARAVARTDAADRARDDRRADRDRLADLAAAALGRFTGPDPLSGPRTAADVHPGPATPGKGPRARTIAEAAAADRRALAAHVADRLADAVRLPVALRPDARTVDQERADLAELAPRFAAGAFRRPRTGPEPLPWPLTARTRWHAATGPDTGRTPATRAPRDVDQLAARVREAGTWTVPRYAHLDAYADDLPDVGPLPRPSSFVDLAGPEPTGPRGGIRYGAQEPQDGPQDPAGPPCLTGCHPRAQEGIGRHWPTCPNGPQDGPTRAPCPLDPTAGPCRCRPGSVRCRRPQEAAQEPQETTTAPVWDVMRAARARGLLIGAGEAPAGPFPADASELHPAGEARTGCPACPFETGCTGDACAAGSAQEAPRGPLPGSDRLAERVAALRDRILAQESAGCQASAQVRPGIGDPTGPTAWDAVRATQAARSPRARVDQAGPQDRAHVVRPCGEELPLGAPCSAPSCHACDPLRDPAHRPQEAPAVPDHTDDPADCPACNVDQRDPWTGQTAHLARIAAQARRDHETAQEAPQEAPQDPDVLDDAQDEQDRPELHVLGIDVGKDEPPTVVHAIRLGSGRLFVAPVGTMPPHDEPDPCPMAPYAEPGPDDAATGTPWGDVGTLAPGSGLTFDLPDGAEPATLPDEHRPAHTFSALTGRTVSVSFHLAEADPGVIRLLFGARPSDLRARRSRARVRAAMRALHRQAARIRRTAPRRDNPALSATRTTR